MEVLGEQMNLKDMQDCMFIDTIYWRCLGRNAEAEELCRNLEVLWSGRLSRKKLLFNLVNSPEADEKRKVTGEISSRRISVEELLSLEGREFIKQTYLFLTGKPAKEDITNKLMELLSLNLTTKKLILEAVYSTEEAIRFGSILEPEGVSDIASEKPIQQQLMELYEYQNHKLCILENQLAELIQRISQKNEDTSKIMDKIQNRLEILERSSEQKLQMVEEKYRKHQNDIEDRIGAMARDLMRTKWGFRDFLASGKDDGDEEIQCIICKHHGPTRTFQKMETDCIFAGGHLVRYVCPKCGCIFGPKKVLNQSPEEFGDDYVVHYSGFRESDCTWKERDAFELLKPDKKGVYLDYGCGKWSSTIETLRAEGYTVFGYEPYACDVESPYIITDKSQLLGMRFDGIFSNDVLEHLADPNTEMQFMKSLLRTPDSMISHSTSCFAYKYEYTRFHLNFLTGESVQILAKNSGMKIVNCVNELEERDFYCYVFACEEWNSDLLPQMKGHVNANKLCATKETPIYGPYLTLPEDDYCFRAEILLKGKKDSAIYQITAEKGKKLISTGKLCSGGNHIRFHLTELTEDVELVIPLPEGGQTIQLNSLHMEWE